MLFDHVSSALGEDGFDDSSELEEDSEDGSEDEMSDDDVLNDSMTLEQCQMEAHREALVWKGAPAVSLS